MIKVIITVYNKSYLYYYFYLFWISCFLKEMPVLYVGSICIYPEISN